jgi:hypothetical protein
MAYKRAGTANSTLLRAAYTREDKNHMIIIHDSKELSNM